MESVFDHQITAEEIKTYIPEAHDKDSYLNKIDEDKAVADICFLYSKRGDEENAQIYFDKIQSKDLRNKVTYGAM